MYRSHIEAIYVTRQEARNLLSVAQWLSELQLNDGALQDALVGAIVGQAKLGGIQLLQVVKTPDLRHTDLAVTNFHLDCTEDLTTIHSLQESDLVDIRLNVESTNVSQSTWDRAVDQLQDRQTTVASDKPAAQLSSECQILRTLVNLWSLDTAYRLLQPIMQLLSAHGRSMTVLRPLVAQLQQPHAAQVDRQQSQHAAAPLPGQPSSTPPKQEALVELAQQLLQNMSSEVVSSLLTLLQTAHKRLLQLPLTDSRLQTTAAAMHAQLQQQQQKQQQERPQQHAAVTGQQATTCAPKMETIACVPRGQLAKQKQLKRSAAVMVGSSEAAAADVQVPADATNSTTKVVRGPSGKKRKADFGLEYQQPHQPEQQQQPHNEQDLAHTDSGPQKQQRDVHTQPQSALQQQQQSQQPLQPAGFERPQQQPRLHSWECRPKQHPQQQPRHRLPSTAACKGDLPAILLKLQQLGGLRHKFCQVLVNRMKALDCPRLSHDELMDIVIAEVQELAPYIQLCRRRDYAGQLRLLSPNDVWYRRAAAFCYKVPGLVEAYIKQDPTDTFVLVDRTLAAGNQPSRRLAGAGPLVVVDSVVCRQFGAKFTPCPQKVDTCKCRFGDFCRFSHLC